MYERFWAKVDKTSSCWLWVGQINQDGYGKIKIAGKTKTAHRVSWEFKFGPIPNGICVLHTCDIRACVNPTHLWLGTTQDNTRDMITKGRYRNPHCGPKGEASRLAKLTNIQVMDIRNRYRCGKVTQRSLAIEFKVHEDTIRRIVNRKLWKHL
jgi:hypothetical protein